MRRSPLLVTVLAACVPAAPRAATTIAAQPAQAGPAVSSVPSPAGDAAPDLDAGCRATFEQRFDALCVHMDADEILQRGVRRPDDGHAQAWLLSGGRVVASVHWLAPSLARRGQTEEIARSQLLDFVGLCNARIGLSDARLDGFWGRASPATKLVWSGPDLELSMGLADVEAIVLAPEPPCPGATRED
jgi:hypothetical protein